MKKIVLLSIFFYINIVEGQNLFLNESFENCSGEDCILVPNEGGQCYLLNSWYEGQYQSDAYGPLNSPDWYWDDYFEPANQSNVNAHTGDHFIGIFHSEGVYYEFDNPLDEDVMYKFSAWIKASNDPNKEMLEGTEWGISLYASDRTYDRDGVQTAFENNNDGNNDPLFACDLKNRPQFLGSYTSTVNKSSINFFDWRLVQIYFTLPRNSDIKYILITGKRDSDTDNCGYNYFFIDDVSLTKECCPYDMKYQNTNALPTITSVEHNIYAAKNIINSNYFPIGNVEVLEGQNVSFYANNEIILGDGFIAYPGSNFLAEIKPCTSDYSNNANYELKPNFIAECDGFGKMLLFSSGYEMYDLIIKDIWDTQGLYSVSGIEISSQLTELWDGICNEGPYEGYFHTMSCPGLVLAYALTLYNCNGRTVVSGNLTIGVPTLCDDLTACENNRIEEVDTFNKILNVFPNPSNGTLATGATATASLNVAIDVINGHMPDFSDPGQTIPYVAKTILDGVGAASVGSLAKGISNSFGYYWVPYSGTNIISQQLTNTSIGLAGGVGLSSPIVIGAKKVYYSYLEKIIGSVAAKTSTQFLEGAVKSNYGRFVKAMPVNAKSSSSWKLLDDGNYLFEATSPATNIPGSKAVYQKWVNTQGETFKMLKTTYAPDGSVVHIKPKF